MANLGLIDFKLGLYIKVYVNAWQNKFEVHNSTIGQNGHQLAQNRPNPTFWARTLNWALLGHFLSNFNFHFFKCLCFEDKSNGGNN